jgi:hypothetical protein
MSGNVGGLQVKYKKRTLKLYLCIVGNALKLVLQESRSNAKE